ncbi:MAG: hypothetical protein UX38_C0022G0003 [Microgenomates group bacterium GW2011_GWC1_46_16]|uniref:Type II secretion system protein GspG C-terminal domain-containing protein n=2 Tax=Candidatus Collieribacteriota TaxID=1752725 RepID=A0A1F5FZC0_9BACT|nr:MAG: hypothetical protein UX32_C0010G0009 [Microgenomates group bacterium GW2011_GWF1_46_12]KKU25552.1 MAG: hypothetical protein UX38_C0022G0003 [Microgenomates group bacterium GW2011_GWC1_46_16]KKU27475.1 MAG: hypothetical protein UX40_C0014G0010 [Microgenomates group bacterium GW2011_GWF2_46_18]KKU60406.1 MAG: hypothetical protein UX82_C0012G0008 [Microgenomates group bacterium GW2011_GWE1_47_12]KKU62551.1 MAG: hypothetical protein UX84_C0005G0032 [Microgenomates group bacterium GW2011_GWD
MKLAQSIKRGFTLIELLVVIGILAILLAITLIAINPQRQFQQANDTQRSSNVNAILNAVGQYAADNNGDLPGTIPTGVAAAIEVGRAADGSGADLCSDLVPTYIAALPVDPTATDGTPITTCPATGEYLTGYTIYQDANRRVTVHATGQITSDIDVTR